MPSIVCALPGCPKILDAEGAKDGYGYCSYEHLAVGNTLELRQALWLVAEQLPGNPSGIFEALGNIKSAPLPVRGDDK